MYLGVGLATGTPSGGSALAAFFGIDPNGTWSLYITDDTGSDFGSFTGGWTLELTLATQFPNASSVSIADLGGDATAGFDLPESTVTVKWPVLAAGATEFADISLLGNLGVRYYFGVKTVDQLGLSSFIDLGASVLVAFVFAVLVLCILA